MRYGYRYSIPPPKKRGWQSAQRAARRATCEVSGVSLFEKTGRKTVSGEDVLVYVGVIDHIVPERYLLWVKIPPHAPVNLMCVSSSVHGKKRAAEDAFLKRGDVLTFYNELNQQGWDMRRVEQAMSYAGLMIPNRRGYDAGNT
jgi:hypothetical protein